MTLFPAPYESIRPEILGAIRLILDRVVPDFMARRNVVACGVGLKIRDGEITDEPALIVSVTHKVPAEDLDKADLIPKKVGDVATDVIETGEIKALGFNRLVSARPVRPGVSIGHKDGTAGTLGCLVRRNAEVLMLSNNHVLALLNEGQVGDAILQPGPGDGGTLGDAVGELAAFVPLRFLTDPDKTGMSQDSRQAEERGGCAPFLGFLARLAGRISGSAVTPTTTPADNLLDAALARPFASAALNPSIIDVGSPPAGLIPPALGLRVIKSGRTSGLTQGRVVQIDVTVDVTYGEKVARFRDQLIVTPFSQPGDSGSLVLDYERRAVGLLFSGSDNVSVVTPIAHVLNTLGVTLITDAP